ncbi:hypothetical protein BaRGS_00036014 [Batillaria attramentaria]|uniref:RWD domain-containing protein n=1 Tax=Batillaria attramentaria TaxID=370345 RepID=A0ABD0JD56_9CAEN
MSKNEENADVREMLELQLAEVEMLESMFANPGEFILDSPEALQELRAFIDGTLSYECLDARVGFTIKISTSESSLTLSQAGDIELVCHLPHEYPNVLPEVFTRAPSMDRDSHRRLKEDLHEFLASQETGQIMVGLLVDWLQENAHKYVKEVDQSAENNSSVKGTGGTKIETSFTRLWIYSHHIYSKFKRRDIFEWASELGLRGFSMPGKPGIVCVEGGTQQVDEFWYRVRRLNWKRIMIKEQEVIELEGREIASLCKFGKFQELELEVQGGKGRNYHMDLGQFYEFLQEHDSANIFPMYFGVEGKTVGDS